MKKIVIIDGIHFKAGFTNMLIESFIQGAKSADPTAHISRHELANIDYGPCTGCGTCMSEQKADRGTCVLHDAATEIINEALEADVVVLATPIYEYCVSSTLKKFLERCLPLGKFGVGIVPRVPVTKGKKGIIICTSGAPFPFSHLMGITWYPSFILKKCAQFFGCAKTNTLFAGGMAINEKTKQKYLQKAFELGKNL